MKLTSLVLCASMIMASSGCATIFSPGPDRVPISSNPPGARVYVDDQLVGQTPVVVELDRERSQGRIRVEAEGYHPAILLRSKDLQGWFIASICLTGLVGIVVDLVTHNYTGFDDTPVTINLIPGEGGGPPPAALPPPPPAPPGAVPPPTTVPAPGTPPGQ